MISFYWTYSKYWCADLTDGFQGICSATYLLVLRTKINILRKQEKVQESLCVSRWAYNQGEWGARGLVPESRGWGGGGIIRRSEESL